MSMIEDGTGSGSQAKVTSANELMTRGVVTTGLHSFALKGRGFVVSSGIIDLTSASPSAVLYLKNTGTKPIIISSVEIGTSKSKELSGTPNPIGTYKVTFGAAITTHDLVGVVTPINLSGATFALPADVFSGAEGKSVTSLATISDAIYQHGSVVSITSTIFLLNKDATAALTITPPSGTSTGNDKMQVVASAIISVTE